MEEAHIGRLSKGFAHGSHRGNTASWKDVPLNEIYTLFGGLIVRAALRGIGGEAGAIDAFDDDAPGER